MGSFQNLPYINALSLATDPNTAGTLYVGAELSAVPQLNAFAIQLNPAGDGMVYSTTLGGAAGSSSANGLALDSEGNLCMAGITTAKDFPTVAAFQPALTGKANAFVATLNADGSIVMSSFLGGTGTDDAFAATFDPAGNLYLTGFTSSNDFPLVNPFQKAFPSGQPAGIPFIAKIATSTGPPPPNTAPLITNVSIAGKRLMVTGQDFGQGAVIVLNGQDLPTSNDDQNSSTALTSKKGGKKIHPGDPVMIQVRNPDGTMSNQFSFIRPAGG